MPDDDTPGAPTESSPAVTAKPSPIPGLYHRIYLGYVLPSLKPAEFTKTMNGKFLPLFPKANPVGLAAYRPALPKSSKTCPLPSEVALLSFTSEKDYGKYRETKIGKKIREAHTPVFRADSKSVVPEALTDTIHFGHAYSLSPGNHDYRGSFSTLVIHCDPVLSGEDLRVALVKPYALGTEATDVLFAVTPTFVAEYVFFPKAGDLEARIAERNERFKGIFRAATVVRLPKRQIGKKKVSVGEGIDAQWR